MFPGSELSQLLKNARNRLADKQGVPRQEIERQWAEGSGYSVNNVHNWLQSKNPGHPPNKALCYIIKLCLKEGVLDSQAASRMMQYLSEPYE